MPASVPGISEAFHQTLKAHGVRHMVSIAHSESFPLISRCMSDPEWKVISACREGEGVAIAAGLALGGKEPVLVMECVGLFECCDTLRGLPVDMKIPMLLIIGYFGKQTPGWQRKFERLGGTRSTVELASDWTEPFLKTMGIPYYSVDSLEEIGNLEKALRETRDKSGPVAVLVERMVD